MRFLVVLKEEGEGVFRLAFERKLEISRQAVYAGVIFLALIAEGFRVHSADEGEEVIRPALPVGRVALPQIFRVGYFGIEGEELRPHAVNVHFQFFVFNRVDHIAPLCANAPYIVTQLL